MRFGRGYGRGFPASRAVQALVCLRRYFAAQDPTEKERGLGWAICTICRTRRNRSIGFFSANSRNAGYRFTTRVFVMTFGHNHEKPRAAWPQPN